MPFGPFGPGGGIAGLMFTLVPLFILGVFAYIVINGIRTWAYNNSQPQLTRPARAVGKRQHVWHSAGNANMAASAHTSYYATFEFEDGERIELPVGWRAFGEIAEGDVGMLTNQGTRFFGFERERL